MRHDLIRALEHDTGAEPWRHRRAATSPAAIEAKHLLHRQQAARRPRSGIRHDDGPIPSEYARRREAENWAMLGWGAAFGVLLMMLHMMGVGL